MGFAILAVIPSLIKVECCELEGKTFIRLLAICFSPLWHSNDKAQRGYSERKMLEGLFLGAVSPAAQSTLKSYPLALNGVRTVVVLLSPLHQSIHPPCTSSALYSVGNHGNCNIPSLLRRTPSLQPLSSAANPRGYRIHAFLIFHAVSLLWKNPSRSATNWLVWAHTAARGSLLHHQGA